MRSGASATSAPPAADPLPRLRRRILLIGLPMAGGAGLVVHILADASLPLGIAAVAAIGAIVWVLVLSPSPPAARRQLYRRAGAGAIAGLIATLAYDAARYGTVALFSFSFKPFHVISVFGELFVGSHHPAAVIFLAGFVYHLSNGTFFGVAYTLVFRTPRWWTGTLWGAGLELCMATLYPSWLRIQQLGEFLQVSALGHVVYGSVLGLVAGWGVARWCRNGSGQPSEPSQPSDPGARSGPGAWPVSGRPR